VVRLLVEAGASIGMLDAPGRQALHYAAMCGFPDVTRLLLEHKAEPNAPDSEGYTPLFYAVANACDALCGASPAVWGLC
jgi:ankyrin repeat protein